MAECLAQGARGLGSALEHGDGKRITCHHRPLHEWLLWRRLEASSTATGATVSRFLRCSPVTSRGPARGNRWLGLTYSSTRKGIKACATQRCSYNVSTAERAAASHLPLLQPLKRTSALLPQRKAGYQI